MSLVSVEEDISLGLARIYKAYTENTTHDEIKDIVLSLEKLFYIKYLLYSRRTITNFVEALIKDRLLILVECALNFNDEHKKRFIDDLFDAFKKLKNQSETKIILVFHSSTKPQELQLDLEIRNLMPPTWDNLSNEFQENLLNKQLIVFQGHKGTSLKVLIGDNNEEYPKIVSDQKILLTLINNEKIVINIESCNIKSSISQGHYVKRTFTYQREIKTDIFTKENMEDLFLISNTNKEHLKSLGLTKDKIRLFQENDPVKNNPIKFIIAEHHQVENNFKQLCIEYSNFNIHWLKSDANKQIWQQSHGSLIRLNEYLERGENNTESYSESDLLDKNENLIIISDTAGMGKSTVLTFLAQEIKVHKPASLVFRIDLNMYTEQLDTMKEKGGFKERDNKKTFEKALQFLAESMFKTDDSSKRLLLQFYCQYNIGNMIMMFDGFDEISPDYKDEVIDLVQTLRNGAIKQIWITTRPNMQKELENEFQQFAHALKPFSKEDQQKFLTEFWQEAFGVSDEINKDKFKTYAGALINLLAKSISDKEASFTGVPLQTKMLAEAFKENLAIFYKSNETVPKLPENLDLIDLYERFLKHKHEIYQKEKNGIDLSKPGNRRLYQELYRKFIKEHEILALHVLFNEEEFEQHFQKEKEKFSSLMNEIKGGNLNYGLIDRVINDKIQFIHRTFAEYLVAKYLVLSLENQTLAEFVLQRILIKSDYQVIRAFFNDLLTENSTVVSLPECALKNYGELIKTLWLKNKMNLYNEENKSLLHVAAEEDNENIARFLLKSLEKHDNDLKFSIMEAPGTNSKYSPLCLAAEKGHLKIAKCLVENGACVNWTNQNGETVLHCAVRSGKVEIVKYFVEICADVNAKNNDGETVLQCTIRFHNLKMVKYLVEIGVDANAEDNDGRTVLHRAVLCGNLEIVKYLVEIGVDVNAKNNDGGTVLHRAVESGKLEIVKYFVEIGVDVNAKNNDGGIVLHRAVESGKLEIVKYLVEIGVDVKAKNSKGETVLQCAVRLGKLEIVKYLVEIGADLNAEDNGGWTVLQCAMLFGYLEMVKYFVEIGVDVNAKNNDGITVLHRAVESDNLEIAKYLVEIGADVNAKHNSGITVLHRAIMFGNLEIVKYLVEIGVDVNAKNNYGMTVLQWAVILGKLEIVKYLEEIGVDVKAKTNDGETVLHRATESG